jgi:glycosyltransferase involved in cell wall biosynthesis
MNSQPLVSITILVYQHGEFLEECIDSILNQTYKNIEIIICDDGSKDNSQEIIKRYAALHSNIKPILFPYNKGVGYTQLAVLNQSKGEYICLYDGDDIMYPEKIEKQVAFLEENQDYDMCFHDIVVYDNDTKTYLYKWLDKYSTTRNAEEALFTANWFFKKNTRRTPSGSKFGRASYILNGFTDKRAGAWIEFNFYLGMYAARPHAKWHTIPEVLGVYRLHNNSISRIKASWLTRTEEANMCYELAMLKFPQYIDKIKNEQAFWWFNQLLYNQVPKEFGRIFHKEFYRKFGLVKYTYLYLCKLFLNKKLSGVRQGVKKILLPKRA